jgi:hypothetical protein
MEANAERRTSNAERRVRKALLAAVLASCLSSCSGLHGNFNAGVTGKVTDPNNAEFRAGGQIDFARKPSGYAK